MIPTEKINENTRNIDLSSTYQILELINEEDMKVAVEVKKCLVDIAKAVDIVAAGFEKGGRLLYFGAGTSGRLGVLDASECPPTFSTPPDMVQGIIAGGEGALRLAVEGAEDSEELALKDFNELKITPDDTVVSISASGNAKYVIKILQSAKSSGCKTIGITSNPDALIKDYADVFICAKTGPEAISGSTRMKAGTAQKMILNMLSTASMVKIGKTFRNLMIDVNPTNEKLRKRAVSIVSEISGFSAKEAQEALENNGYRIKHAVVNLKYGLTQDESEALLNKCSGVLRKAFSELD